MGDRMLAAARCDDRHLLAVGRRAAERRVDGAVRGYRTPVRERQIAAVDAVRGELRSEEHTSELQSLMRISYAVFCLKKKKTIINQMIFDIPLMSHNKIKDYHTDLKYTDSRRINMFLEATS